MLVHILVGHLKLMWHGHQIFIPLKVVLFIDYHQIQNHSDPLYYDVGGAPWDSWSQYGPRYGVLSSITVLENHYNTSITGSPYMHSRIVIGLTIQQRILD